MKNNLKNVFFSAVVVDLVREEILAEIFQPTSNFLLSRLN